MQTTRTKTARLKMVTQDAAGKDRVTWLPRGIAWAAARGIARDTHFTVTLHGEYATARFFSAGDGEADWGPEAVHLAGQTTYFCPLTTVCI